MKKIFLIFAVLLTSAARADRTSEYEAIIKIKTEERAKLEERLAEVNARLADCNKAKKGWVAGVAVGAAGVVATGTAAAVQAGQIKKKKSELADLYTKE